MKKNITSFKRWISRNKKINKEIKKEINTKAIELIENSCTELLDIIEILEKEKENLLKESNR